MIEKEGFKQLLNYILVAGLFILAFLVIKSIFFAMIYGILLAYILYPIYKWTLSKLKNESLSAFVIFVGLLIILIILFSVILVSFLNQIVNIYLYLQKVNIVELIKQSLPDLIFDSEFSSTLFNSINISISKLLANFVVILGESVLNIPNLMLQVFVVFLVFFFCLKDGEKAFEYFKSLSPMKKEIQNKFFKNFEDITQSVLIGQIVVGILQGIVSGIGYFLFGVPNAVSLTILTIIVGIIPVIGPWLVWIPVDVYLFSIGRTGAGLGLLIYGLFLISWIDNIIRPMIVSRKTQINQAIVLIGMIGGVYVFGIIGLIIGPLILAYVLLVLEVYRKQNLDESIIFKEIKESNK